MRWFKRSEFACNCGCGFATVDYQLAAVLDDLRTYFGKPTSISSGCRCREYNEKVQKEANPEYVPYTSKSKHMYGIAADIKVSDVEPRLVYNYLDSKYPDTFGMGLYKTFVHIDVRTQKARW